jgi:hypothetical protein
MALEDAARRRWHALDENDERSLTRALTRFDGTGAQPRRLPRPDR